MISPVAFILVPAHAVIQFRRMLNEEKLLKATLVEYEHYAAQTPGSSRLADPIFQFAELVAFAAGGRPASAAPTVRIRE